MHVILYLYGYDNNSQLMNYLSMFPLVAYLSIIIFVIYYIIYLLFNRERYPLSRIIFFCKNIWVNKYRLITSFFMLFSISIFTSYYSSFKAIIPLFNPFWFDKYLLNIDKWLFSGYQPWQLIHNLYTSPWISFALDLAYQVWFFLVYMLLCYYIVSKSSVIRSQYIITWLFCWIIIGNLLALLLSSAGPVYAYKLFGYDDYLPLMKLLYKEHAWLGNQGEAFVLWSLNTQKNLWLSYSEGKNMLGGGISAMPSMHVSMATLMALGSYQIHKFLGWGFILFALIIYIGSFSLGWHYALDGMVSAPLTYIIWYITGKLLNKK
nr:hypothetical protein BEI47_01270 [Aliivibrio fischeri]